MLPATLGTSGLQGMAMFFGNPVAAVAAVFFATCTAIPVFLFIWFMDRNEPEPMSHLALGFLWGAFVATAISMVFNGTFEFISAAATGNEAIASFLTASFAAPFIEEITKGAALLFLYVIFRDEFDNALDGMVYGAIVGLGFAWFENIIYYMTPFMDNDPSTGIGDMVSIVYLRGLVSAGWGSHAAYTALTGLGFGIVRQARRGWLRYAAVPLFLSAAMFAHFAWNTFIGPVVYIVSGENTAAQYIFGFPFAALLLQGPLTLSLWLTAVAMWWQEDRVIQVNLSTEAAEHISAEELALLTPSYRRTFRSLGALFSLPLPLWLHRWRLRRLQIKLAFARWHHNEGVGIDWPVDLDRKVVEARAAIVAHRSKAA
jgi:RsiW-degrading membrane proteinase PrsW (M82 family)